jgi:hypothetical protein
MFPSGPVAAALFEFGTLGRRGALGSSQRVFGRLSFYQPALSGRPANVLKYMFYIKKELRGGG